MFFTTSLYLQSCFSSAASCIKNKKAGCSTAWPPWSLHLRSSPVHHREPILGSKPRPQTIPQVSCFSSQKRISQTFPFLSKILDKLQPLPQNRNSATDHLTTSRQWKNSFGHRILYVNFNANKAFLNLNLDSMI